MSRQRGCGVIHSLWRSSETSYAGSRGSVGEAVQLCSAGGAGAGQRGSGRAERPFGGALLPDGPAVDPARDATAGDALAGVLFRPVRADVDGADRLQSPVPLVCWAGDGRRRLASDGVHAQPRPASRDRSGPRLPGGSHGAAWCEAALVWRPLLGRRHADRCLGQHEELPGQGWLGKAAGPGPQRRARLPQGAAVQRDPTLPRRIPMSGSTARRQAARAGSASWAMRSWRTATAWW